MFRIILNSIIISAMALGLAVSSMAKNKPFEWDEITDGDWAVVSDTVQKIHDAAFIFEKVTLDDRKLKKHICYYTVYRLSLIHI